MKETKEKLETLINRNEVLKPIVFKSFETEKELDIYTEKNQNEVDEYYDNQEQIEQLEHELMSEGEKEDKRKLERFLELKAKGEPFDPEEEGLL